MWNADKHCTIDKVPYDDDKSKSDGDKTEDVKKQEGQRLELLLLYQYLPDIDQHQDEEREIYPNNQVAYDSKDLNLLWSHCAVCACVEAG